VVDGAHDFHPAADRRDRSERAELHRHCRA
jgi:hypothetical protein